MKNLKKLVALAVLMTVSINVTASDFGTWLGAEAEKKVGKFSFELGAGFRAQNNMKSVERWDASFGISYKPFKFLKFAVGYNYIYQYRIEEKRNHYDEYEQAYEDRPSEIIREYDGYNINKNAGSTHPESMQAMVRASGADLGVAFDGDADRCLAADAEGNMVNGDQIMGILARAKKREGKLNHDTLVVTVMSNLGLKLALKEMGIDTVQTNVGDRYVLEEMLRGGYNIGGEQSGHVLLTDLSTAGDGMQTAIALCNVLLDAQQPLSVLKKQICIYPQVLVGAHVKPENKHAYQQDAAICDMIAELETAYAGNGRVLIRPSGTEHLIRVMMEGPDQQLMEQQAHALARLMEERLG